MLNSKPIYNTQSLIEFQRFAEIQTKVLNQNLIYVNRPFDKGRLKILLHWSFSQLGEKKTIDLVERLKYLGYSYATKAGLSLSIEDLLIPQTKKSLLTSTQQKLQQTQEDVEKGFLTSIEYVAQVLDRWNATSEQLKDEVITNFQSKDTLNPVYMMAFSGARGNIAQVRQLTGMRGLMADPSGQIIDFPIESNFREGLTLTEYMISCYGARKGVVDTALRTATSGYLTRRLVDSAHHVIISGVDCETNKGIVLSTLKSTSKTILNLKSRLLGRVLAKPVYDLNYQIIGSRNEEINSQLATRLTDLKIPILLRSPMTCNGKRSVCQRCYGWSLAISRLVTLGESVGIIAAQSIGEPGTQLTMRTFHTGGVFSSDVTDQICAPSNGTIFFPQAISGYCVRTSHGQVAFLTKEATCFFLKAKQNFQISLEPYSLLFVKQNQIVQYNQVLAEFAVLQKINQTVNAVSTIYSTLSGEIKFTNAQTVHLSHDRIIKVPRPPKKNNADNPLKAKQKPKIQNLKVKSSEKQKIQNLNVYPGEFWILAAQKQTFLNKNDYTMVQQGDWLQHQAVLMSSNKARLKLDSTVKTLSPFEKKINTFKTSIFKSFIISQKFSQRLQLQNPLKTGSHRMIQHSFFQWNNGIKKQKSSRLNQRDQFKSFASINLKFIVANPIKFLKKTFSLSSVKILTKQKKQKFNSNKKQTKFTSKRILIKNFLFLNKKIFNENNQNKLNFIKNLRSSGSFHCSQKCYRFFLNKVKKQKQMFYKLLLFKTTYSFTWNQEFLKRLESPYYINNSMTPFNTAVQTIMTKNSLNTIQLEDQKNYLNLIPTFANPLNLFSRTYLPYNWNYTGFYIGFLNTTKQLISNYMWYSRLKLMNPRNWFLVPFFIGYSINVFNLAALKLIQTYSKFILEFMFFKQRLNSYKTTIHSHIKILKNYRQTRVHNFPIDHKLIQKTNLKQIHWPFSKTNIQIIKPFKKKSELNQGLLNQPTDLRVSKKKTKKTKNAKKTNKTNKVKKAKKTEKIKTFTLNLTKKSNKNLTALVINQNQLLNYLFHLQIKYQKEKLHYMLNPEYLFVCHILLLNATLNTIKLWVSNQKRWQKLKKSLNDISNLKQYSNYKLNYGYYCSNYIKPIFNNPHEYLTDEIKLKAKLAYFLNDLKQKHFKIKAVNSFAWLNPDQPKTFNSSYLKLTPFYLNLKVPVCQINSILALQWYDSRIKNIMTLKKSHLLKPRKNDKRSLPFTIKTYNYKERNTLSNESYLLKILFEETKKKETLKLKFKKSLDTSNDYKNSLFNHWFLRKPITNKKLIERMKKVNTKTMITLTETYSNQVWFEVNAKKQNKTKLKKIMPKINKLDITVHSFALLPYFSLLSDIQNSFSSIQLARLQFLFMLNLQKKSRNLIYKFDLIRVLTLDKLDNHRHCLKLKRKLKRKLKNNFKNKRQKVQTNSSKAKIKKSNSLVSKKLKKKSLNVNSLVKTPFKANAKINNKTKLKTVKKNKPLAKRFKYVSKIFDTNQLKNQKHQEQFSYANIKLTQYYGWVYAMKNLYFDQNKFALMGLTGLFDNRLLIRRNFALSSNLTTYQSSYDDVWKTMLFPTSIFDNQTHFRQNKIEMLKPLFSAYVSLFTKQYIEKNLINCFSTVNKTNKIALTYVYTLALRFYSDVIYLKKTTLKFNKKAIDLKFKLNIKNKVNENFVMQLKNEAKSDNKNELNIKNKRIKAQKKIQSNQGPRKKTRTLKKPKTKKLNQLKTSTLLVNKTKKLSSKTKKKAHVNKLNHKKLKALNLYYRLFFFKRAKIPLINYKTKFKTLPCLTVDRILLLNSSKIYYHNYSRYQPELLLNKLCYKPALKTKNHFKQNKQNLNILFKMTQLLAVIQKPEEIYPQSLVSEHRYQIQKQNFYLNTNKKTLPVQNWLPKSKLKSSFKSHFNNYFYYTKPFKMHYYYYAFFTYYQALENKSKPIKLATVPQLKNYSKWFIKIERPKTKIYKKNMYYSFWTRFRYNVLLNKLTIKKHKFKGFKTLNSYNLESFMTKQNSKIQQHKFSKTKFQKNLFEEKVEYFLRYNNFCFKMISLQHLRQLPYKNRFKKQSKIQFNPYFKLHFNAKKRFQLNSVLLKDFLTPLHCLLLLNFKKTVNLTKNPKIKPETVIKKRVKMVKRKNAGLAKAKKKIQAKVLKLQNKMKSNATKKLKHNSNANNNAYGQKINKKKQKKNKPMLTVAFKDRTPIFSNHNNVMFKQRHHLRCQQDVFQPGLNIVHYQPHTNSKVSKLDFISKTLANQRFKSPFLKSRLNKPKTRQISANEGEVLTSMSHWQWLDSWHHGTVKKTNNILFHSKRVFNIDISSLNYNVKPITEIITLTNEDLLSYQIDSQMHSNTLELSIGDFVPFASPCFSSHRFSESGQILEITKEKLVLRRAKKFALSAGSSFSLEHNNFVNQNAPLLKLNYKQIVNEDIIQGIPRIERLFEARSIKQGFTLAHLLQQHFRVLFQKYRQWGRLSYRRSAAIDAVEFIQHYTLDAIQSVYQSQGVTISDKHVEIIIKQMTSKVMITEPGKSSFLRGDLIHYHMVLKNDLLKAANVEYRPFILGITQVSLKADGFISAASFQETVNILTQATYFRKTDFLLGLKERVVLGGVIPCGTGLPTSAVKKTY